MRRDADHIFTEENRQWCGEWPLAAPTTETPPTPPTTPATPAPDQEGAITRVQRVAQEGITFGELIAEGISPWTIASWAVDIVANLARKLRGG
jgi:hypothetical protein